MTAMVLEYETNNYWNLIKNVSTEIKLALISKLSNALISEVTTDKTQVAMLVEDIVANSPSNVPLTDKDIIEEIQAVRQVP